MLVKTRKLVSAEEFRNGLEKYLEAARKGSGPIGITQDSEVIGFFITAEDYERLYGAAIKKLLSSRMKCKTVSTKEVRTRIRSLLQERSKKL
jgi:prevent-host-death family protein